MAWTLFDTRTYGALGLALCVLFGCGGDGGPAQVDSEPSRLATVSTLPPGARCALGGVQIDEGADVDRDGLLDAANEIERTQVICNGAQPENPAIAVRTKIVLAGERGCAAGGSVIDVGLDDGVGGGTARDGVLDDAEVESSNVVCDRAPIAVVNERIPTTPPGAEGTARIRATGGVGTSTNGGSGGGLILSSSSGSASVFVFRSGVADTSAVVFPVSVDLGSSPLEVTDSLRIERAPKPELREIETVYIVAGPEGESLGRWTGETFTPITGLRVGESAKVAFDASNQITLRFAAGIDVRGSLAATASLTLLAESDIVIARSAQIVFVLPSEQSGSLTLDAAGTLSNEADITFSGAAGRAGGFVKLTGKVLSNAGDITVNGGASITSVGASGGFIVLTLREGSNEHLVNTGRLSARGGSGLRGGGRGGSAILSRGRIVSSGAIDVSGGNAGATCPTGGACAGGNGGSISIDTFDSEIRSAGALTTHGGSSPTGKGGAAGTIRIARGRSTDALPSAGAVDIEVSGELDASGGDGAEGGSGADIEISAERLSGGVVTLLGYASIDLSGGAGRSVGGSAGGLLYLDFGGPLPLDPFRHVHVHPTILLRGGDGSERGGAAGALTLRAQSDSVGSSFVPSVLVTGDVALEAGSGAKAGNGGSAELQGRNDVVLLGSFGLGGGRGADPASEAPSAGMIHVKSDAGNVEVLGDIDLRGSDSVTSEGGSAGTLELTGRLVRLFGAVTAAGGAGSPNGGDGGIVRIRSRAGTSIVGGEIDLQGGVGTAEPGTPGTLAIDVVEAPTP